MRRRRKTGNGPGTKRGKPKQGVDGLGTVPGKATSTPPVESKKSLGVSSSGGDIEGDMSVTTMDVVDTTTHQHFGHGHRHPHLNTLPSPSVKQTTHPMDQDLVSTVSKNNKAVGARKRKPTQISKIVDKPISEPESGRDDKDHCEDEEYIPHNNNNNSPPHKKAYIQSGEKNGMIQNIVTELKSAKKASSSSIQLDFLFPKSLSHSIKSEGGAFCSSEDENSLQIEIEEEEEPRRRRATNKNRREGKVDLANIRTLFSPSKRRSESQNAAETSGEEDEEDESDGMDMRKVRTSGEEERDHQQLPFRCGVCRFGTTERGVLLGHMKTHSGERSFQCRLCCFAFTTKANCERHLRNRHGQIEKDQIRNLVVVFSSSSSNNSDSETESTDMQGQQGRSPSSASIPINKNSTSGGLLLQRKETNLVESGLLNLSSGRYEGPRTNMEKLPTLGGISLVTTAADEQPLDLSMDAVDLSTKNRNGSVGSARASLLRPRPVYPTSDIPNLLVTSPFITKREAIVHPQLSLQMLGDEQYSLFNGYSPFSTNVIRASDLNGPTAPNTAPQQPFSLFPFGASPPYNPFSFPTPTMDKVVPGLSNNVVNISPSKVTPTFMAPSPPTSFESRESLSGSLEKELKLLKPNKKETKKPAAESNTLSVSPTTTSRKRADAKSGEYQKPKQRRYRTERPFSCPHCPARFTLRSNMERHGKHQHPSVWQRSPSNRVINRQQKNQQSPLVGPPTMVQSLKHSINSSGSGIESKSKGRSSSAGVNGDVMNVDVRAVIAQQLKRKLSNSALLNGTVGIESETDSEPNGTEGGRGADSSDLASVSQLLERVKNSNIAQYFHDQGTTKSLSHSEDNENEEEEDLSGTESPSGSSEDEGEIDDLEEVNNDSNSAKLSEGREKKKSAYSSAPHKISCPHCTRRFPWTSSLRRHLLTHTGQKPYQCSQCPLLFTTKSNCDRHLARKHSGKGKCTGSGYNSAEDDDEEEEDIRDDEEGDDGEEEVRGGNEEAIIQEVNEPIVSLPQRNTSAVTKSSNYSSPGEDVSFRCHLCEAAASERDVLLAHMEEDHKETYSLLVSKGALTSSPPSENSEAEPIPTDLKEVTHRKVMCVFCVRRFWSVEDLRRHIRSHSGERPFSCTHCSRRFTLKHSMLRHLKKHAGEEIPLQTPKVRRDFATRKKGSISKSDDPPQTEETNLIGRLLGIHDEGLVEQLLNRPDAKDAAKLLGLRVGLARQNTSLTTSN